MFTDLDASDSSGSESNKKDDDNAGDEVDEKATSVASSVKTHSESELSGFTSDSSTLSDENGTGEKTAEKEQKKSDLEPAEKSTKKKIHEFFHGPEIIIDWFARLDSSTCGVKARVPVVPGKKMEPIVWMEIDTSLTPGTQVKFVCPHSEGPQKLRFADVGESCEVCVEMADCV